MARKKDNATIMAELKAKAEKLAEKYNDFVKKSKFEDAFKTKEEVSKAVNEYTATAKTNAFNECKAADDPMREACQRVMYDTIRIKETPVEGSVLKEMSIEDTCKLIDLKKLDTHCKGIGHDPKWYGKLQRLNQLMTARQAYRAGINPVEVFNSYYMGKVAKSMDEGEAYDDDTIKTKLNELIVMMLGDGFSADENSTNMFIDTYASLDKKSKMKVMCSNHKQVLSMVHRICYAAITGEKWDVAYKEDK